MAFALLVPSASGAQGAPPGQASASAGGDVEARLHELRMRGFDAIYNLDYPSALTDFEEMVRIAPNHPAGHFYLATHQWLTILDSMRRVTISVYNRDSFYAGKEDRVDPKLDRQFQAAVQKAIDVAQARVNENPKDVDALYYLGAAYGMRASYSASVARKFTSALGDGRKGVNFHRKVVELDPTYADAYLSIGLYDYIVGTLPGLIKVLVGIVGVRGSRKRGLEEIHLAAEKGRRANDDARIILIALYEREGNYAEALKLLDLLAAKYPRNYLFGLERASALAKNRTFAESYVVFDQLLKNERARAVVDLIHFEYGQALLDGGEYSRAAEHFAAVTKTPAATPSLTSMAHLHWGQALDAAGRRKDAVAQYELVLKREDVFDSHAAAERYLKRPYAPSKQAPPA
jgi:tetratricopeptide (TPR) repeat protein